MNKIALAFICFFLVNSSFTATNPSDLLSQGSQSNVQIADQESQARTERFNEQVRLMIYNHVWFFYKTPQERNAKLDELLRADPAQVFSLINK